MVRYSYIENYNKYGKIFLSESIDPINYRAVMLLNETGIANKIRVLGRRAGRKIFGTPPKRRPDLSHVRITKKGTYYKQDLEKARDNPIVIPGKKGLLGFIPKKRNKPDKAQANTDQAKISPQEERTLITKYRAGQPLSRNEIRKLSVLTRISNYGTRRRNVKDAINADTELLLQTTQAARDRQLQLARGQETRASSNQNPYMQVLFTPEAQQAFNQRNSSITSRSSRPQIEQPRIPQQPQTNNNPQAQQQPQAQQPQAASVDFGAPVTSNVGTGVSLFRQLKQNDPKGKGPNAEMFAKELVDRSKDPSHPEYKQLIDYILSRPFKGKSKDTGRDLYQILTVNGMNGKDLVYVNKAREYKGHVDKIDSSHITQRQDKKDPSKTAEFIDGEFVTRDTAQHLYLTQVKSELEKLTSQTTESYNDFILKYKPEVQLVESNGVSAKNFYQLYLIERVKQVYNIL